MKCIPLCLAALLLTSAAEAQTVGRSVGELYLSAAPDSYDRTIDAQPFVPFDVYLVAEVDYGDLGQPGWNLSNGIRAWEAHVNFPGDIIVTGEELNPTNAVCVCLLPRDYLVGLGTTFAAQHSPWQLMRYSCLIVSSEATDLPIYLSGTDPSTFAGRPGFVDGEVVGECSLPDATPTRCKRPFARRRSAIVNCTVDCIVPTETPSWSQMKSRFLH